VVNHKSIDLLMVATLAILAAEATFSAINAPFVLPLLTLPLVFLLPGYALTSALFPKSALGFPETLTFSLGLSLAADIIGGLVINLTPQGLSAVPWTVFLCGVTLGGCAVAALNRPQRLEPMPSPSGVGLSVGQTVLLGLSIVVVACALMLVRDQSAQPSTRFTELWAQPDSAMGQNVFDVGVRNSESQNMEYELEIKVGGNLVYQSSSIALSPGETLEKIIILQIPVNQDVQAFLYRMDDPGKMYREVVLRNGGK